MMYQYFDRVRAILDTVEKEEKKNIDATVSVMVNAIINKKSLFAFGASHAGILTQELFYRAGGLLNLNPIFGREIMLDTEPISHTSHMERLVGYGKLLADKTPFSDGDVLILHSVSGRNPVTIEMAMEAQKRGVTTISITNLKYSKSVSSRHPSGKNLYHFSDIVIDNHGDIGDATCDIEGLEQKVSPSSTVVGATIVNTIVAETVRQLVEKGMKHPPIFYSANLDGGDELNRKLYEEYKDTIFYRY
ncbi:SIS domain-containing protein [Caldifermentibacillus hisashii]|uniref:SIS domain-containing protein n=1 Tax=Caldifermentibacillus hisashii TaxID=996558 RepID=A0ABU9K4C6_9BACI|nr:SIS domain-containing protein [Caldibacillus thermoamylovorans]MCM3054676.1 SIS domain-containing protein [Caldibacillus thermoamylovorans]